MRMAGKKDNVYLKISAHNDSRAIVTNAVIFVGYPGKLCVAWSVEQMSVLVLLSKSQ
jgi:hypothetical protein